MKQEHDPYLYKNMNMTQSKGKIWVNGLDVYFYRFVTTQYTKQIDQCQIIIRFVNIIAFYSRQIKLPKMLIPMVQKDLHLDQYRGLKNWSTVKTYNMFMSE